MTARTFRSKTFGAEISSQSLGVPTAAYPGRVATNSDLIVAVDRQQTRLALPMGASDTTMTVTDPSMIVAFSLLSIDNEIVKSTGLPTGNVVPISRAFDGTTAAVHLSGAMVSGMVDAWHHNALVAEIEAIEFALGPNLSRIPVSATIISSAYDFAPIAPGGNLLVGANVITVAPVPLGVNGSDTNHFLWITGGTGTPEAVPIIGGTAVSGAATGTVIVTCANTHSGAWTLRSATSGVYEAANTFPGTGSGEVVLPAGQTRFHQKLSLPIKAGGNLTIRGQGEDVSFILRSEEYVNGDLISYVQAAGFSAVLTLRDFTMYAGGGNSNVNSTSGAAIHIVDQTSTPTNVINVRIFDGWRGLWLENTSRSYVQRLTYIQTPTCVANGILCQAGIYVTGGTGVSGNIQVVNCFIGGGSFNDPKMLSYGIYLSGTDGIQFTGGFIAAATIAILFDGNAGTLTNGYVDNMVIDGITQFGILFQGSSGLFFSHRISNTAIQTYQGNEEPRLNGIKFAPGTNADAIQISNCNIFGWSAAGVSLNIGAPRNIVISDNLLFGNGDASGGGYGIALGPGEGGTVITGNRCYNNSRGQDYGIGVLGNVTNIQVTGNQLSGNRAAGMNITGTVTGGVIRGNTGVDDVIPAVASAATLAFPVNPLFTITGTVGVTAVGILQPAGANGILRTTTGAVTFTAGATIGNTFTTVQNVPVQWSWDGTKVWFH